MSRGSKNSSGRRSLPPPPPLDKSKRKATEKEDSMQESRPNNGKRLRSVVVDSSQAKDREEHINKPQSRGRKYSGKGLNENTEVEIELETSVDPTQDLNEFPNEEDGEDSNRGREKSKQSASARKRSRSRSRSRSRPRESAEISEESLTKRMRKEFEDYFLKDADFKRKMIAQIEAERDKERSKDREKEKEREEATDADSEGDVSSPETDEDVEGEHSGTQTSRQMLENESNINPKTRTDRLVRDAEQAKIRMIEPPDYRPREEVWYVGLDFAARAIAQLVDIRAENNKKGEHFFLDKYFASKNLINASLYRETPAMAKLVNEIIEALNTRTVFPSFIIILPDGDIIPDLKAQTHDLGYFDTISVFNGSMQWMVNQIFRAIETRKEKIPERALCRDKIIPAVYFIKAATNRELKDNNLRVIFNKSLEIAVRGKNKFYSLNTHQGVPYGFDNYLPNGRISAQGFHSLWRFINKKIINKDCNDSFAEELDTYQQPQGHFYTFHHRGHRGSRKTSTRGRGRHIRGFRGHHP